MLDASLFENDPPTYSYCYYRLVCCYGRVALGQRVCESERTNQVHPLPSRHAPRPASTPAGPLAFLQGLFEAPWRGFDTGIFGQWFRPEIICCGRSGWRRRRRYFGRRQLFWLAGHFCFEKQRRPNFCRAGLLFTSSESSSRRSGPFGFRFRRRSGRVCNHPRRFRSNDEDQGLAQ